MCGGDDSKLHLFVCADDGKVCWNSVVVRIDCGCQYCRALALSGHEDWIRGVHIVQEGVSVCV